MKKATHSEEQGRPYSANFITKPLVKTARILAHLLTGASLNRFEAERLGDHCLNSTVSALANRYGLAIQRKTERVPNNWGAPCHVNRYSLPRSQYERAAIVLSQLKRIRLAGEE
jgi:hypothetical protein